MTGDLTDTELAIGLFIFALPVTLAVTARLLSVLRQHRFLDRPNARSSHTTPTPRGGGLAVIAVLVPVLAGLGLAGRAPGGVWLALGGVLLVAAVSLVDDLRGLGPLPRLAVQAAAVALAMPGLLATGPVFQGLLPGPLDAALAGLAWIWFINLFNFMDGIDAIAGAETVSLGVGLALVAGLAGSLPGLAPAAAAAAGAAAGFLWWNRPPARVFLGDVGSVPLGYLLGWLLLMAAAAGAWQAALILPLYYLADATLTLLRRLLGGRPVWRAHREHFYQMATAGGRPHGPAVGVILAGNVVLILLALAASTDPGMAPWPLAGAVVVVAGVLARLAAMGRAPRRPGG